MEEILERGGEPARRRRKLSDRLERRTVELERQGVPIVVSAPSGGGKTTLCHRVIDRLPGVEFSVSHTTRPARSGEVHGSDYFFVDNPEFDRLIEKNAFLEWAHVHGRRYGTSRKAAQERLAAGTDVLFDIDVQGGKQIQQRLPNAVLVFVVPPSMEILASRLRKRHSDSEEEIARRLAVAAEEIKQATFYTHWIVNDDLDRAVLDLESIVRAERVRNVNRPALFKKILGS
jgi:guanylate kinase